MTAGLLLGLTACGGGSETATDTATTPADIFDGAAIGCSVTSNGVTATEVGNGVYTFDAVLIEGSVATAIGCKDSDTQSQLPQFLGVIQSGAVVISPITTLIVEAAVANDVGAGGQASDLRTGVIRISATELDAAKARIVTNLGLGDYQLTDPKTANYIEAAKADPTGTLPAAVAMRISLSISTPLKSVEVSVGAANASAAVAASLSVVDLKQSTHSQAVLAKAQTLAAVAVQRVFKTDQRL
ncbi:MAG: hypothetical protein ACI8XX_000610 [Polaribacter sp.]